MSKKLFPVTRTIGYTVIQKFLVKAHNEDDACERVDEFADETDWGPNASRERGVVQISDEMEQIENSLETVPGGTSWDLAGVSVDPSMVKLAKENHTAAMFDLLQRLASVSSLPIRASVEERISLCQLQEEAKNLVGEIEKTINTQEELLAGIKRDVPAPQNDKTVWFTVLLRVEDADLLRDHAEQIMGEAPCSLPAAICNGVVNPAHAPLDHGYEIMQKHAEQILDKYMMHILVRVFDEKAVIAEAKSCHEKYWQDGEWEPENVERALYDILVACNDNAEGTDQRFDIGVELIEFAPGEPVGPVKVTSAAPGV